jgi:hypothetical protein
MPAASSPRPIPARPVRFSARCFRHAYAFGHGIGAIPATATRCWLCLAPGRRLCAPIQSRRISSPPRTSGRAMTRASHLSRPPLLYRTRSSTTVPLISPSSPSRTSAPARFVLTGYGLGPAQVSRRPNAAGQFHLSAASRYCSTQARAFYSYRPMRFMLGPAFFRTPGHRGAHGTQRAARYFLLHRRPGLQR